MAKYTLYVNFKLIRRKQFDVEVYAIIIDKIMQVAFTYFQALNSINFNLDDFILIITILFITTA